MANLITDQTHHYGLGGFPNEQLPWSPPLALCMADKSPRIGGPTGALIKPDVRAFIP
ncbi:hypothetical protein [Moorena sp. SIO3H5]|uniref:hypothetical protein n=1 Tax=Moorena sp. SIO3H5 TaxID=2607834 RepID=UPI0013BDF72C|nr:hypothetical protein [Moorena sp. SIO3H5]NEO74043.1 hypothetical protein [Moorena sp. SIO3H5]